MTNTSKRLLALIALVLGLTVAPATFAQTLLTEDFTKSASSASSSGAGNWLFYNGACLTAGTSTVLTSPAVTIPACTAVLLSYYQHAADGDQYLMGGANGYLGGSAAPSSPGAQQADPVGSGALRFTNGSPYGNQERGAIVSTNAYSTSAGIQVTFKTVTYGGSGADGISFYLMDGCAPVAGANVPSDCTANSIYPTASTVPAIGATGGSLAYTCTNEYGNGPPSGNTYDGLTGAYLGLGIDEFGNFLNQGDNTATGYGFQAGRIGLRGAGSVSWPSLTAAYGVNPNNSAKPYYPALLASCPTGSPLDPVANLCVATCPSGATYGASSLNQPGSCTAPASCPTGSASVSSTVDGNLYCFNSPLMNSACNSGYTYHSTESTNHPAGYCQQGSGSKSDPPNGPNRVGNPATATVTTPNSSVLPAQIAVQNTCSTGHLWNYASSTPTDAGTATLDNTANTAGILDYAPIPGAYLNLPSGNPLYNGSATTRAQATTIFYNLKITVDGFLSLSYSYGGGSYQSVIANKSIQASNGQVPNYVRFGFAGSTGGSTNVHEILCFKSAPAAESGSSAGVNEKQSAKVESGTFAYFAYYDPNTWVGRVTANALNTDINTGDVTIAALPNWDADCVLTGIASGQKCSTTGVLGPTAAQTWTSPGRTILTYNGVGVPFEWANLSTAQQTALTTGDTTSQAYRLNYLRGDRTYEINSAGTCNNATSGPSVCFRARTGVLGDVVDSSPTWVGPPQSPYTATWQDRLYPTTAAGENSGTQTYQAYVTAEQSRPNVVYSGSNDGMLHGFRSGGFDSTGTFTTATTPNDGAEVIAYMPGSLLLSPSTGGSCSTLATTGSIVQNIHGVTPAFAGPPAQAAACVTTAVDFSAVQYGHNFFVDATPGTGDLYYAGTWHTWLVGGLGAGGAAIYALDVTNPTSSNYVEGNAASLVIGEWTSSTISCVSNSTCGTNLGNTYGTPIIRRLHDGKWAAIFGNGYNSSTGDAGIYVMTVSGGSSTTLPTTTFYYLSTGKTGTNKNNGIGYVASADLDGDHITDYVYAGDLMGNVWRFDLTSATESNWAVSKGPLFTTPTGQPITTQVTVASGATTAGANTLLISFGTGMRNQFTNSAPVSYQTPQQSLYGVWDWNLATWNANSPVQYATLTATASGLTGPNYTLGQSNLQQQVFTLNTDNVTRDIASPTTICWAGSTGCSSTTAKFGWYLNLIGSQEQIIYNPQLLQGVFTVNSIVPANNTVTSCVTNTDTGFTYAISLLTGGAPPSFFVLYHDTVAAGIQTNAVGTSFPVTSATGTVWLISQTVTNTPIPTPVNPGGNAKGRRLTWVQLR